MPIDRDRIQGNGWRQGSVFRAEHTTQLLPEQELPAGSRLILVSHDCDVLHRGTREPVVEVCAAVPLVDGANGNFRYAKNPRVLHLELNAGGVPTPYEATAYRRFFIERAKLEDLTPDPALVLPQGEVEILTRWLAKRYERVALPDAFGERLDEAKDDLRGVLKDFGHLFTHIFLGLEPEAELPVGTAYRVHVYGVMKLADYEDNAKRIEAGAAIGEFAALMGECDGVDVLDHDVYGEDDISLHDLRGILEYNCDDISLEADGSD